MLYWLNLHSGAVQAITAIGTLLLTLCLVLITAHYVRLTKTIAETTQRQLSAALQPRITMSLGGSVSKGDSLSIGVRRTTFGGALTINNEGSTPIKIKHVYFLVQARDANDKLQRHSIEIDTYQNRLLMPAAPELSHKLFSVKTLLDFDAMHSFVCGLQLECADVAEVTRHQFVWSLDGGLRHSSLTVRAPTFWAIAVQRLRAIKKRMDQMAEWDGRMS